MIDDRKTDTTIFLLPVLGINRAKLNEHNFIDAFLDDVTKQVHYMNCVYILFQPENMESFQVFLEAEKQRYPDIVDDYDYAGGWVVVVYRFPKELLGDMSLILEGKYSETSIAFKKRFAQVKKIVTEAGLHQDVPSLQWLIFKKSPAVKESWEEELQVTLDEGAEVWEKPNMSREVLDIEEIKTRKGYVQ